MRGLHDVNGTVKLQRRIATNRTAFLTVGVRGRVPPFITFVAVRCRPLEARDKQRCRRYQAFNSRINARAA